jgi:hypothetical protein
MAAELLDRLAIWVTVHCFHVMGVTDFGSLTVMSVCNISVGGLRMLLFGVFLEMCGENSCNVFLELFMVLWVPISATLSRRAVLMLPYAFLFMWLRFFPRLFL